jgi:hypothetical protein
MGQLSILLPPARQITGHRVLTLRRLTRSALYRIRFVSSGNGYDVIPATL